MENQTTDVYQMTDDHVVEETSHDDYHQTRGRSTVAEENRDVGACCALIHRHFLNDGIDGCLQI